MYIRVKLLLVTDTETSELGRVATPILSRIRSVLLLLCCWSYEWLSASQQVYNTASRTDGGIYSENKGDRARKHSTDAVIHPKNYL